MYIGSLTNTAIAERLHPLFKIAFDYIKTHDLSIISPCTIELCGRNLYIMVQEYNGKKKEEAQMEAHENYIDIQIPLIGGHEQMGWQAVYKSKDVSIPYNIEKDIVFYNAEAIKYFLLQIGEFVIFFPEDVHAPSIGTGCKKKILIKVKI